MFAHEGHGEEDIVVIGRATDLMGVAASASQGKVGRAELDDRPFLRPGEILEFVPGLIATQHSGTGKANQYFLRGFNLDHGTDLSVKVGGVPANLPSHGHGQGYLDVNFLIPELVASMEYKKGPYYSEAGDFSSAGSAEISYFDELPYGFIKTGVGLDHFRRLVVANNYKTEEGNLVYALETQNYDGPWRRAENLNKANALLKYTEKNNKGGFSLTGMAYGSRWDASDQLPSRLVQKGELSPLGTLDATNGGKTSRYEISGKLWHLTEDTTTELSAYVTHYRLNLFSNFTYFAEDPANGDQFEQVDRRNVSGLHLSHDRYDSWGDLYVVNTFGLDFRHDRIPHVALHKTAQRHRLSTVRDDQIEQSNLGLYYKNKIHWSETLRTTVGLRGHFYYFDVDSKTLPENSGNRNDEILNRHFGVALGPWSQTEFFANYGTGFHSNDARGTVIQTDPQTLASTDYVDPLVKSEGAEVGLRSMIVPGLHSTISAWALDLDSELLFVGDAGNTEAGRPSRRTGFEFANHYTKDWLTLHADVAHTRARYTDRDPVGKHIPGAIETVISIGVSVDFESGFFGSLQLRQFGRRPLDEGASVHSQSTAICNMQAGYQKDDFIFTLDVLNLLDSDDHDIDYYYESQLSGEGSPVEDVHFHPVEPRTFRAYLTYKF